MGKENTGIEPTVKPTPVTPFFKDADVEQKYKSVFGVDKHITIPGIYMGQLSGITKEVAEKLISLGDNQVAPKA